jgi:hypothetical protein
VERNTVQDRVQIDIERGDYGLARERLSSLLATRRYDDSVLIQLGQVSFDMHDLFQAGRFWLVSSATGPQVDRAIAEFMRRCGNDPVHAVSQLPRCCRLTELSKYPGEAQDRLQKMGMAEAILTKHGTPSFSGSTKLRNKLIGAGIFVLVVSMIVSCIVGAGVIIQWFWKLIFG